jgi:2-polyprenyl-6-methoxyphenol hydroxylase-like FAD-dependent oxidoreductase
VSLVEGLVPGAKQMIRELWDLLGGSALIALGGERTIGMGTKPDGSVLLYAGVKTRGDSARRSFEEASGPDQRVAWFHANFQGWSKIWDPLFKEAESMVWRPLLVCPTDQHWKPKRNVTLIGDAAHVMPPYAGEGVNMAMLDALVLSRLLLSEDTSSDGIAAYEAEMFARMRHMTEDTMMTQRCSMHQMRPIALWLCFVALAQPRQFRQPQKLDASRSSQEAELHFNKSLSKAKHDALLCSGV